MSSVEHPPSLLVVDDDDIFRERLGRAFVRRGYEVRTAGNYEEAVALSEEESAEFAVVDLRMPGRQSGLDVLRALKRIDALTRVVMLTGYGSIATTVDAMRLGATNYLPKPADADDIIRAFERSDAESRDARRGDAQNGDAQNGDAQNGDAQNGDAQNGDAQNGDAQELETPSEAGETAAEEEPIRAPTLARAEWEHIHRILADCDGNISEASRRLGIHRRSLQRKLQKFAP